MIVGRPRNRTLNGVTQRIRELLGSRFYSTDRVDYYKDLFTSLDVKQVGGFPAKVRSLLDQGYSLKTDKRLQTQLFRGIKDSQTQFQVVSELSSADQAFKDTLYASIIPAAISKQLPYLAETFDELHQKLGPPQASEIERWFSLGVLGPSSYCDELARLLQRIPLHLCVLLVDTSVEKWHQLGARSDAVVPVLIVAARRGVLPRSKNAVYVTASYINDKSIEAYVRAIIESTDGLARLHVSSDLARFVGSKVARLPNAIDLHASFTNALGTLRPLAGQKHPIRTQYWSEVLKNTKKSQLSSVHDLIYSLGPRDKNAKLAIALQSGTVDGAYRRILKYTTENNHISASHLAVLYSQLLRLCARDAPDKLSYELREAERQFDERYGRCGLAGRRRLLLTGILRGLKESSRFQDIIKFLPAVQKTRTSNLWAISASALAKEGQVEEMWALLDSMKSKSLAIPPSVALDALLASTKAHFSPEMLVARIQFLYDLGVHIPLKNWVTLFHDMSSGRTAYRYKELAEFYYSIGKVFETRQATVALPFSSPLFAQELVKQIIWAAFLKNPTNPTIVLDLFLKMQKGGMNIPTEHISKSIEQLLQQVYDINTRGEFQRVRAQSGMTLDQAIQQFNTKWMAATEASDDFLESHEQDH